jgi:hypothetical protein
MRRQLAFLLLVLLAGQRTVSADFIVDLEEDEKECFHIRVSAKGSILSYVSLSLFVVVVVVVVQWA